MPQNNHVLMSFFVFCVNRGPRTIEPGHRLLVTIRFMATGELYRSSMRYSHRMPHNTLSVVIRQVAVAIHEAYKDEVWVLPSTPEQWKEVADGFSQRWNFHHCIGAIDGKHVEIVKPGKTQDYFNYKSFHSIVMLAIVDANYCFQWCSVGHPGKCSDAGIFNNSTLKKALARGTAHLPPPEPLPNDDRNIEFFLVGDEAFPLTPYLMKKYPTRGASHGERIFNYRSSRARLVVENSFGILANRWRCLTRMMYLPPHNAEKVTLAALTLHNVLRRRIPLRAGEVDAEDGQGNIVPGAWRQNVRLTEGRNRRGNQVQNRGREIRDYLKDYYNAPVGAVAWQERAIDVHRFQRPVQPRPAAESESESDSD